MIKLTKYDKEKTYMYPNGAMATPESVLKNYPAVEHFIFIAETDEAGECLFALENLSAMRSHFSIDPGLFENDAIAEIEVIRNTPPPEPKPDAAERIAAALELQNLHELGIGTPKIVEANYARGLWSEAALDLAVEKEVISAGVVEGLKTAQVENAEKGRA